MRTAQRPAITRQAQQVLHDLMRAAEIATAGEDPATATLLASVATAASDTMIRHHQLARYRRDLNDRLDAADAATAEAMVWTPVVEAALGVARDIIARTGALAADNVRALSPVTQAMLDAYRRTAPGDTT